MRQRLLAVALAATLGSVPSAFAEGRACELVTPEELAGLMGGKPALKPSVQPDGVEVCTGKAAGSTFTLRLYSKGAEFDAAKEKAVDEHDRLQKMGALVESRRVGGVNCSYVGPGGKASRHPYTTTCTVSKGQRHAVVELKHPSLSRDMKELAPLAQNVGSRFWQL